TNAEAFSLATQTALAAFVNPLPGSGILGAGGVFKEHVAGSTGTFNVSGMIEFDLLGDGSLANPFRGSVTVTGGVVGFTGSGSATAAGGSNLRQIVARGSGNGFTFSFNGFVNTTGDNVLGTLTVTLADGSTASIGVFAPRQ